MKRLLPPEYDFQLHIGSLDGKLEPITLAKAEALFRNGKRPHTLRAPRERARRLANADAAESPATPEAQEPAPPNLYLIGPSRANRQYHFWLNPTYRGWIIVILDQPDYQGRPENVWQTHRVGWSLTSNTLCVCWEEPIRSLRKAKSIAQAWAYHTDRYILYNTSFGP